MNKKCSKCKEVKPLSDFYKSSFTKDGYKVDCKDCAQKYNKKYRQKNKNKARDCWLKYSYNITLEDYNKLFNKQDGCCAICKKHQSELKKALDTDHDHKTKKVRGLLCNSCNSKLGWYENNSIVVNLYLEGKDAL